MVESRGIYSVFGVIASALLAWYVGGLVANENYKIIGFTCLAILTFISALTFGRYWMIICMIPVIFRGSMAPIGFRIGPAEICLAIIGFYCLVDGWRKNFTSKNGLKSNFGFFGTLAIITLAYFFIHTWINIAYPFNDEDISVKNCLKTIVGISTGFCIIIFAARNTHFAKIPKNFYSVIGILLILGNIFNSSIRAYGAFVLGEESSDSMDIGSDIDSGCVLNIPFLNFSEDLWGLRSLAPYSALFALMMLYSKSHLCRGWGTQVIGRVLLILSLIGALLSGGRSVLLMIILTGSILLLIRKQIVPIILVLFLSFLMLLSVKVIYTINSSLIPLGVQRSMAIIPFMGLDEDATVRIQSSSDWRYTLFRMGLEDWQQSTRTLLTGRSNYAYTEEDNQQIQLQGQEGELAVNLRRGTTHNLITDLLVPFGFFGLILYMACMFALINSLWRLRREMYHSPEINDLTLLSLLLIISSFLQALLGGGYLTPEAALTVALAITLASQKARENKPLPDSGAEKVAGRPGFPLRTAG